MKKHAFSQYVLKHPINPIWIVIACVIIPLMGWLASIVLGFVTLKQSWRQSLLLLVIFVATNTIYSYFVYQNDTVLGMLSFVSSVIWGGIFLWVVALLRKQRYAWHVILLVGVIFGVAMLLVVYAYMSELGALVATWLEQVLVQFMTLFEDLAIVTNQTDLHQQGVIFYQRFFVPALANYFLGALIVSFVYVIGIGQLMIANWWDRHASDSTSEFWQDLLTIRMPASLSIIFIAVIGLLFLTKIPSLFGLLPILVVAWLLAGLSLIHAVCHKRKLGWLIVLLAYVALLGFGEYGLSVILLVACLDSFVDFRRRCSQLQLQ